MKMIRFGFKLHFWQLNFKTNNAYIKEILRAFLPYYFNRDASLKKEAVSGQMVTIALIDQTKNPKDVPPPASSETVYNYVPGGFYTRINFSKNTITVYLTKKNYLRGNWVYHCGFLNPLSLWLRKSKSMLLHGALIEKNKKGILLLGPSGSGKSTLSVLCVQKGYRYYSDEHPILSLSSKGKIRGRSFFSAVRIPPKTAGMFDPLKKEFVWSKAQKKYFLNLNKVFSKKSFGRTCSIETVLFPSFSPRAQLSVKALPFRQAFRELCRDEYSLGLKKKASGDALRENQLNVLFQLINSAKVYRMRYGIKNLNKMPDLIETLI